MRTMVDVALHRWLVGFTIDSAPKHRLAPDHRPWTGVTLYVGPFAFGLWVRSNHRFGAGS